MKRRAVPLAAVVASVFALAACGSSDEEATGSTAAPAAGETSAGPDVAAAKKAIAPFIGKPSPFPVTEKLEKTPKGASIATVDSGTPVSSLMAHLLEDAAKTMGVSTKRFKAGHSAPTTRSAFDSIVAARPDAVMVNGIGIDLWTSQLKTLQQEKVPLQTSAILGGEEHGLEVTQSGEADGRRSGKLMANYVIAEMNPKANVVVYSVPEIPLLGVVGEAASTELKRICPSCEVRTVDVPVGTIGNKAPNTIVSDLQAHPKTDVAVFATGELQIGLPDALAKAGIEIKTLCFGAGPTNLQHLKDGKETAALAYDLPVLVWTQLDQVARSMSGQKLSGLQAEGLGVVQFLTQKDITFDVERGWTGYPDFHERFAELWGVEG